MMYKSPKMRPCPKCSNHGKTVVNHCPYWDCQCTSCKQTDILAALKLEHSQLMQGLNPGSLQKISIEENLKASQDREGTLNNNRSGEPKSLLECKVKVTDERKMDNIEPVKQIDNKKILVGVDENLNCVQKNAKGNLIKRESVENRNYLKQKSKGGFDIKSEYIEFESNMSELLAKPTIANKTLKEIDNMLESKIFVNLKNLRAKFDEFESKIVESLINLKDIKKEEDNGLENLKDIKTEVQKNNTNKDDIVSSQNEGSVQTTNLSLKLSNVSLKSENLFDASNPNTVNPTPPHLCVKQLPTVNPKRETVVVQDLSKTQCPQSSFVTPIGTLSNFTSCKGIKLKEINSLLERKIIEKEGIGLKNLKDIKTVEDSELKNSKNIKTEVQKNETKETEKCSITQDLETNKFGQEMQNHSPDQKHEKNIKIEGNSKVKSETSPVSSFDVAQENAIQNFTTLPDFVTKVEKGEHIRVTSGPGDSPGRVRFQQGTLVKNVTNAQDPLITVEFKVQKSKEVKVDTVQFEAGNNNNPDLKRLNCPKNEKKQLRSKRPKFDEKMLEKPKRRVYMKKNMIERFKFGGGGGSIEANRKDCGYREGCVNDVGGYNRGNSGYSVYGGYRGFQGCQGKSRWRGNDVYGAATESFRYREENVDGMGIDGGGYSKDGYSGGRYRRYRNIGEYRGGVYQGDIGYRSEYGDGSNSGGGFIGGGGRDGGGYEESHGDCTGYGKGKGGVRDYERNGRGGGYGGGAHY